MFLVLSNFCVLSLSWFEIHTVGIMLARQYYPPQRMEEVSIEVQREHWREEEEKSKTKTIVKDMYAVSSYIYRASEEFKYRPFS